MKAFGELFRQWRIARGVSQLKLELESGVSTRHISFIENGRAVPSRGMVLKLARALDIPRREVNTLLAAAGHTPVSQYRVGLDHPDMAAARLTLELILQRHEPHSALVFDRCWDLVMVNRAYAGFMGNVFGTRMPPLASYVVLPPPRLNLLRLTLDPSALRPHIANWDEVAPALLGQFSREVLWTRDPRMRGVLDSLRAYPNVCPDWCEPALTPGSMPIVPLQMRMGSREWCLFGTITTLGSVFDAAAQEFRIESFHMGR